MLEAKALTKRYNGVTTPRFAFVEETVGEVAGRWWPSVLGLVVPAALIAWLAVRRLAPFPVVS